MFERDEHHMSIYEVIPKIHNYTKEEINFIRSYSEELKIDYETIVDIVISTDTVEFFNLLIHTIREYTDFVNETNPNTKTQNDEKG